MIERHVRPHAHAGDHGPPQRIGAEFLDHIERIDAIAERLGHLASLCVAHRAVQVDRVKRLAPHEMKPRHHHARDPEKDDLGCRHEDVGRIKRREVIRRVRPPQRRHRPEPARGPRVEHVLVLPHGAAARGARRRIVAQRRLPAAGVAVEHRNAMPPPELPRDVPVADVLHPMEVHRLPAFRQNAHRSVPHRREAWLGERLHRHEPLVAEARLDHGVAAIAVPHAVRVRLHLHEVARRVELPHDRLARREAIEAVERRRDASAGIGHLAHNAVLVYDNRHRQAMPLTHLEVVRVVRWRELHHARAEGALGERIGDDRNFEVRNGKDHHLPHEVGVPLVLGVHHHGDVAQHRFGTRRGDGDAACRLAGDGVPEMVEGPLRVAKLGLFVGQRRQAPRTPMNHAVPAVDEVLVVEAHERFARGAREFGTERVRRPRPVARAADRAQLLQNHAPRFGNERLHALDERLAPDVKARLPLFRELPLDHVLRRDARVVGPRDPKRLVARHSAPAHDHVLHRVVEPMPHMQHGRDVGRRNQDGEVRGDRSLRGARPKDAGGFPAGIDLRFVCCGVVLRRQVAVGEVGGRHCGKGNCAGPARGGGGARGVAGKSQGG